jgi:CRP/FNR family cyclic AMP-dependent transcriptional regulator
MDAVLKPGPTGNADDELNYLRSVMLFHEVPDHDLQALARLVRFRDYAPGEQILKKGDPTSDLCIVKHGTVSVYLNEGAEKIALASLGEGAYFGELAVFDEYPRSANVAAATPARICLIDRNTFQSFIRMHPAVLFQMCRVFSHRLRNTNSILTKH